MAERIVKKATEPTLGMSDLAEFWLGDLASAGRSEATVRSYGYAVLSYTRSQGEELPSRTSVRQWLAGERNRSAVSRHLYFTGLNMFCKWMVHEGYLADNPMTGLPRPKVEVTPVKPFSGDEVDGMIRACRGISFTSARDKLIVRMLAVTGLRLHELAAIRVADIDRGNQVISVVGKGSKHRPVPYDRLAARDLITYTIFRRKHKDAASPYLLLGKKGRLGPKGIDLVVRKRAAMAGVDDAHAHRFRHTHATDWLSKGGGESALMNTMGWSSGAMLRRYTAHRAGELAQAEFKRLYG